MKRLPPVAALLALLILPLTAEAKVYRWVDAQGQVHYSQTPPPELGLDPTAIRAVPAGTPPPAEKPAEAAKPVAPAAPAAPKVDEKAAREAKAKACSDAKQRISFLEEKTARRLGVDQPDGTTARMTDEEFQDRLGKAQEQARQNCGS